MYKESGWWPQISLLGSPDAEHSKPCKGFADFIHTPWKENDIRFVF